MHAWTDDLNFFSAIYVKSNVGGLVVTLVLKEEVRSEADLAKLREVFERMLGYRWTALLWNRNVKVVCESGELRFCAEGASGKARVIGAWTTRAGHRVGALQYY